MILGRYVLHVSHQTRLPFLIHINFISYDFDLSFLYMLKVICLYTKFCDNPNPLFFLSGKITYLISI